MLSGMTLHVKPFAPARSSVTVFLLGSMRAIAAFAEIAAGAPFSARLMNCALLMPPWARPRDGTSSVPTSTPHSTEGGHAAFLPWGPVSPILSRGRPAGKAPPATAAPHSVAALELPFLDRRAAPRRVRRFLLFPDRGFVAPPLYLVLDRSLPLDGARYHFVVG